MTFYVQCYSYQNPTVANPDYFQFGRRTVGSSTVFYLFLDAGSSILAGRVTVENGITTTVDVWVSMWPPGHREDGSGLIRIRAKPQLQMFEMTVAGVSLGYCGLQLVTLSSGAVFAKSSAEANSASQYAVCKEPTSLCANMSEMSQTGVSCEGAQFALPALGRVACVFHLALSPNTTVAASNYPGGGLNNVNISSISGQDNTALGGPTCSKPTPNISEGLLCISPGSPTCPPGAPLSAWCANYYASAANSNGGTSVSSSR